MNGKRFIVIVKIAMSLSEKENINNLFLSEIWFESITFVLCLLSYRLKRSGQLTYMLKY